MTSDKQRQQQTAITHTLYLYSIMHTTAGQQIKKRLFYFFNNEYTKCLCKRSEEQAETTKIPSANRFLLLFRWIKNAMPALLIFSIFYRFCLFTFSFTTRFLYVFVYFFLKNRISFVSTLRIAVCWLILFFRQRRCRLWDLLPPTTNREWGKIQLKTAVRRTHVQTHTQSRNHTKHNWHCM